MQLRSAGIECPECGYKRVARIFRGWVGGGGGGGLCIAQEPGPNN